MALEKKPENRTPMEKVLYEVKKVIVGQDHLLERLSLTDARWAPISSYSKGMRQRILIAAALLHDPDLLIFDEAQSGLDIANAMLFRHLLQALAQRQTTGKLRQEGVALHRPLPEHRGRLDQGGYPSLRCKAGPDSLLRRHHPPDPKDNDNYGGKREPRHKGWFHVRPP